MNIFCFLENVIMLIQAFLWALPDLIQEVTVYPSTIHSCNSSTTDLQNMYIKVSSLSFMSFIRFDVCSSKMYYSMILQNHAVHCIVIRTSEDVGMLPHVNIVA